MATADAVIKFKRSSTSGNSPTGLTYGEAAVNVADQKMWVGGNDGTSTLFFAGPSGERPTGANGQIQYIFNGGFSASSNLSFHGGNDTSGTDTLGVTGNINVGNTGTFKNIHVTGGISADGQTHRLGDLTIGRGSGDVYSNTVLGIDALYNNLTGINNIAIGYKPLYSNTGGQYNVALGYQSLYDNIGGGYNTAIGGYSLTNNTEGDSNTAIGHSSLYSNIEGDYNIGLGFKSLYGNTGGDRNIAIGIRALYANTVGNYNTAIGYYSLYANTEGINNIAIGYQSLDSCTGGDYNTAIGDRAMGAVVGSNNTGLGTDAGYDRDNNYTGTNNTFIGYNAQLSSFSASNEIALGDSNVTLIQSVAGISLDGGATFGGDINALGNIVLTEDKEIQIGGDDESIVFNGGSGKIRLGANEIQIDRYISHYGDADTKFQFQPDQYTLTVGGTDIIDATPAQVHFPVGLSADGGATFGSDVIVQGGVTASGTVYAGDVLKFSDGLTQGSSQTDIIGVYVDNAGRVLTTGKKGRRRVPWGCKVTEWTILAGETGSITWDVNYGTTADWPNTASAGPVSQAMTPKLVDVNKRQIIDPNWNKLNFDAGDILEFEIDSVTDITNCSLELKIRRNE